MTFSPLVLLSGGMDSSTLLAHSLDQMGVQDHAISAVFVDYGQRHVRERESARLVAAHYGVDLIELDLRSFGASVTSALTVKGENVPHGHYAADNMALTVVPNRNAVLLSAAAGIAASLGHNVVRTAVHAGDHAVYPDCRPAFITALSIATVLGCGVEIEAPFVEISKAQIAARGFKLGVPYVHTWSCYEGGDQHCGRCGTCVERAEAFDLAAVDDPTTYADPTFWREAVASV